MATLSSKVAYPIIIAGFFVIVSFIAINYNNLNASFYLIFLLLVVFIFLFGLAAGQNFTMPVKKLLERADDLSKGELESRFYSESKDEIGQLSNAFNKIAHELEESNYENEKTKKLVGIKIEVETKALKETISNLEQKVQNKTMELQKALGDLEKLQKYSKERDAELAELKGKPEDQGSKKTKI